MKIFFISSKQLAGGRREKDRNRVVQAACANGRRYINSLDKTLEKIGNSGSRIKVESVESEEEIEFYIKLRKSQQAAGGGSENG